MDNKNSGPWERAEKLIERIVYSLEREGVMTKKDGIYEIPPRNPDDNQLKDYQDTDTSF